VSCDSLWNGRKKSLALHLWMPLCCENMVWSFYTCLQIHRSTLQGQLKMYLKKVKILNFKFFPCFVTFSNKTTLSLVLNNLGGSLATNWWRTMPSSNPIKDVSNEIWSFISKLACLWKRKIVAFANLNLKESVHWEFDTKGNEQVDFDKKLVLLEKYLAPFYKEEANYHGSSQNFPNSCHALHFSSGLEWTLLFFILELRTCATFHWKWTIVSNNVGPMFCPL